MKPYLALICIIFTFSSLAQKSRGLQVGFGPIAYKGDLNHTYSKWNSGLQLAYFLQGQKITEGAFSIFIGRFKSSNDNYSFTSEDGSNQTPNTYVQTDFQSFSYHLRFRLFRNKTINGFISPGLGLMRFNPKDRNSDLLIDQDDTRNLDEGYTNLAFAMPIQLGVRANLKSIQTGLVIQWSNVFTDYLDNIGDLGTQEGNDNILSYNFFVQIPLFKKQDQKEVNPVE